MNLFLPVIPIQQLKLYIVVLLAIFGIGSQSPGLQKHQDLFPKLKTLIFRYLFSTQW